MEGSWRKWWQRCRVLPAWLLLLSPASTALVASPGLSAHSHLLPALGNPLHLPDFHWIHGAPFILNKSSTAVEQSCSARAVPWRCLSPARPLCPRVAHPGRSASLVAAPGGGTRALHELCSGAVSRGPGPVMPSLGSGVTRLVWGRIRARLLLKHPTPRAQTGAPRRQMLKMAYLR